MLQKLPYDVFNYIVESGKISGKDLLNLSELYNHRVDETFKRALKRDYNVYCNKNDPKDLYIEYNGIFGKKFRKDRAIVLLVEIHDLHSRNTPEKVENALENLYPNFKRFLRRGDIVEISNISGYRTMGIWMYDGEKITSLNHEVDGYGTPSKEFLVFKEFPPDYWDCIFVDDFDNMERQLNINNIYCPKKESKFYWHEPTIPVLVDKNVLIPLVERGVYKDVVGNKGYYYNYVNVEYQNKKYRVTIPKDFSERDEIYYESYVEGFLQHCDI